MSQNSHESHTDVRIDSRINFFGPVFVFIGTPLVLVILSVYAVFAVTHWHEFVGISGWIVKGVLIFIAILSGLTLFWIAGKAAGPSVTVYHRWAEARGQRMRNKVLYTSATYAIVEHKGQPRLIPVTVEKYNYNIRQVESPKQLQLPAPVEEEIEEAEYEEEPEEDYIPTIPSLVRYEDVAHAVPQGHALLGVGAYGVETCDFAKLMTCWIVGGSSTGKSNTVALKIDEAIRLGRNIKIVLIDPHMKKPDSLYNRIKCYEHLFLFPTASRPKDVYSVLMWYLREFNRRLETGEGLDDLLLIVDEVSNVVEMELDEDEAEGIDDPEKAIARLIKKIARICGQESRGFGMFGWFISQKAAGLAWLRNVVITVIAHKMNMMSERLLACNQNKAIAHDMGSWPLGRVLVYGLGFEEMRVLQQPIFSLPEIETDGEHEAVFSQCSSQKQSADRELLIAAAEWNKGANSRRKLMAVMKITLYRADQLAHQLEAKGLIKVSD